MNIKKIIKGVLPYLIIIVLILLLKQFVITTIRVNGTSMDNTLKDGDIMLLDRIGYKFNDIKRFDIVVVKRPDDDVIKRVIGLPGDHIKYVDSKLYINDKIVDETFSHKLTEDFNINSIALEVIPQGEYFILGDNRTDSYDSRYFGSVKKQDILGKAVLTIFPFNRLGVKK
ncbi:MAG: signal peptidase I [Bacilli bacterium]